METRLPEDFMPEENWRGNRNDNRSGINIYNLGKTAYILLAVFAGFALGAAMFSLYTASLAEREARMLQYYLLELDARVIAAGLKKPDESISKRLNEEKRK